jgi:ribosomal protein S18 acetylase RimI-like enzyme
MTPDDVGPLADIWRAGWREAHIGRVPDALVTARTAESFTTRAAAMQSRTTVARLQGTTAPQVAGFVTVADDEIEQLYVDPGHRGTGVAGLLLDAAEAAIRSAGHAEAWLAVVGDNATARAFYSRRGWSDQGEFDHQAPGPDGSIPVPAHRYVKRLGTSPPAGTLAAEDRS